MKNNKPIVEEETVKCAPVPDQSMSYQYGTFSVSDEFEGTR